MGQKGQSLYFIPMKSSIHAIVLLAALPLAAPAQVITVQPKGQTVAAGHAATFSVTASGHAPLSYQWMRNGNNLANGGVFSGATTPTLSISSVQLADVGYYSVAVASSAAAVRSSGAPLNLTGIPIASPAQFALSAAYDGKNFLVGVQGNSSEPSAITAQLVSSAGALVGSRISTARSGGAPLAAFDGTNYLLVWSADDTGSHPNDPIYGEFISPSGALVGSPFAITSGAADAATDHEIQGIAFDGTNFLVVYSNANSGPFKLLGRFVSTSGHAGGELTFAANANQLTQCVAWNGSTYLVAWQASVGGDKNVAMARTVSKAGALSAPFALDEGDSLDNNPLGIATDGSKFLVVWNHDDAEDSQGNPVWELLGREFTPSGGALSPVFTVADTTTDPHFPFIAFDGAKYLVAWTALNDSGNPDIRGRYYATSGAPLGSSFHIAVGSSQQLPVVASGGGKSLVAWTVGFTFSGDSGNAYVQGLVLDNPSPVITVQPGSKTVNALSNTSFTVAATGNPAPTYQWQLSGDAGASWSGVPAGSPYSGQATGTLAVTGATGPMSGDLFRCAVTSGVVGVNSDAATLTVRKLAQSISFASLANKVLGAAPFTLSATATSGLPVTFMILSGPATFSGGKVTLTGAGTVKIEANQAGNANYSAAAAVTRSFTVTK
jgi:hypothetical protein